MWISRKHYDDTRLDAEKCRAEAGVLARQNVALQNTLEWLCQRLTQSEHERAILTKHYMGIVIDTPEFRAAGMVADHGKAGAPPREVELDIPTMLGQNGMFSDMGNDAARKMGIGWDSAGRIEGPGVVKTDQ